MRIQVYTPSKIVCIAALTLLLSSSLHAQADYALGWKINDTFGGFNFTNIQLDLNVGTNYFPLNGGLRTSENVITPVTGTCFLTGVGGLYCNMQADQFSINFLVDPDLSGEYEVKNQNGLIISTSSATFDPNI